MNIAPGEIGAAAAPLNRARSMPAGFYTDPEIFRREREMIFLKHWFFLCRDDQLPALDVAYLKFVGLAAGLGRRATEEEVREFFAPYGEYAGLAGCYALQRSYFR